MKTIIALSLLITTSALAGPECTQEPKTKWLDEKKFQESLTKEQGYKIKVFKVTAGNCYEIYGWNKDGKKVEIYFSPIDGKIVKESIR